MCLICNSSYGSLLPTFVKICESIAEKIPEKEFWTKGNNAWKRRSTVTKVEFVLQLSYRSFLPTSIQFVKAYPKKSGKWVWRTDWRTECKPIVPSGFTGGGIIKWKTFIQSDIHTISWVGNLLKILLLKIEMHIRLYGSYCTHLGR